MYKYKYKLHLFANKKGVLIYFTSKCEENKLNN